MVKRGDPLSDKERDVLAYIRSAVRDQGYPPTIRELGAVFGIASTNGVRYYLSRLEEKGFIRRNPRLSRGIELVESAVMAALDGVEGASVAGIMADGGIPLLGRVAAGQPILAEENVEDVLHLDGFVAQHNSLFALRVQGDSMKDAGILDGDIVVVRQQDVAKNGDVIVALLDEESTCKRYSRRRDGRVELLPENEAFDPIVLDKSSHDRMQILGRVTAVLRRYD